MTRECQSCAAPWTAAAVPPGRKRPGKPRLCNACLVPSAPAGQPRKAITRARYRAAMRHRASLPQLDLVDMIVRAP